MEDKSSYALSSELETRLKSRLSELDVPSLERSLQTLAERLKQLAADVRLEVRDYEYAETAAEQRKASKHVNSWLKTLNQLILQASEYNIFTSIDVVELSATIELITTKLEKE